MEDEKGGKNEDEKMKERKRVSVGIGACRVRRELLNPGHVKRSGRHLRTLPFQTSSFNSLAPGNEGADEEREVGGKEGRLP